MVTAYRSCPRCGFPLTALDRFCGACGFRASRPCPRCEHDVPNDLPFCNYCGQPFAPVETEEKLSHKERARLLMDRELKAFEDKVTELRSRLLYQRRRALRRRGIEFAVFLAVLFCLVFWAAPFIDATWKDFFSASPTRGMIFSFLSSVLLVLILGYVFQIRQYQESDEIEELQSRLILARERLEEARERARDRWRPGRPPTTTPNRPATAPARAASTPTPGPQALEGSPGRAATEDRESEDGPAALDSKEKKEA